MYFLLSSMNCFLFKRYIISLLTEAAIVTTTEETHTKKANNAKQIQNSEILETNEKGKLNMYNKTEITKRKVKLFHETMKKNRNQHNN